MGGSRSGETCSDGINVNQAEVYPAAGPPWKPHLLLLPPGLNHMEAGCWQASVGLQIRVFVCICCFPYIKCELSVLSTPIFSVSRTVSSYKSHSENMNGCLSGEQESVSARGMKAPNDESLGIVFVKKKKCNTHLGLKTPSKLEIRQDPS